MVCALHIMQERQSVLAWRGFLQTRDAKTKIDADIIDESDLMYRVSFNFA